MNIIFMGTPDFAVPALKKLSENHAHRVVAVFTAPPKPQGRGLAVTPSPVHLLADNLNIPVYTPKTLRSQETLDLINTIAADIIVVVAYGFIVPKEILAAKKYGCLNIHPSKLPKYRGAAPLQRTIINGDSESAVCIMQMDEGLDTGDIILQQDIKLHNNITLTELHDLCANIGGDLLQKVLSNIEVLQRVKQGDSGVVYAHKLSKEEGKIDWRLSAFAIDCKIRGMNPWPGTYFEFNGEIIKILSAELVNSYGHGQMQPGTVLNDEFAVVCGDGMIKLLKVKPAGKKEMSGKDYLNGTRQTNYPFNIL
jgi:methionyl-tRNA formyltransferase